MMEGCEQIEIISIYAYGPRCCLIGLVCSSGVRSLVVPTAELAILAVQFNFDCHPTFDMIFWNDKTRDLPRLLATLRQPSITRPAGVSDLSWEIFQAVLALGKVTGIEG